MISASLAEWLEARKLEAALALAGLLLIGFGILVWKTDSGTRVEILGASDEAGQATGSQTNNVVVDVGGAVVNPGVYTLEPGSRVNEAISQAGGLTGSADAGWVEKYLNRSAKVTDGMKIYIPSSQESEETGQAGEGAIGRLVNLNQADRTELESLPGIGPATADKIIAGRPYMREEELVERKIVGQKVYDQIKESVSLW